MAEVKNAFIKSKMNKDLDDRLIPSGEYRDALNAQISKSNSSDVGSLENVLGNSVVKDFADFVSAPNIKCIGFFVDEFKSDIYSFFTDFTDNSGGDIPTYNINANNFIFKYNINTSDARVLVRGAFLNFSTTNPIIGVNLLEDLLFFTDNRNQPRKINIALANTVANSTSPTYYTSEDQVSVAKYNPYECIKVVTTSALVAAQIATTTTTSASSTKVINVTANTGIVIGNGITGVGVKTNTFVTSIDNLAITTNKIQDLANGVSIIFSGLETSMYDVSSATLPDGSQNPYEDTTFGGDPDFLEDKFVRFSYRFQFDDGENSIFAPFTQPCFIPKQDGYFINDDEEQAFSSTVVDFMENKVTKIQLQIPLPASATSLASSQIASPYKITAIDILYKESDGLAVQVVETIQVDAAFGVAAGSNDVYQYIYESTKPFKTLPSNELIRVYDKIPVKAFSQEVISNRVVYGNFQDKHTPPDALDYQVAVFDKYAKNHSFGNKSIVEYPSSTVKQNRNYQVGVVLSDKFGRQSSTLLSSNTSSLTASGFGASTVFSPYQNVSDTSPSSWPGDSLKVLFNEAITSTANTSTGTPGLYNGDSTSANYNPLGWYSYKIVVQQKEQDYYNVYSAGAMKGNPLSTTENLNTSYVTLLNDNINKVPRDLSEVGPLQKQFRSSVRLIGRVENTEYTTVAIGNKQFYPGRLTDTTSSIEDLNGMFDVTAETTTLIPITNADNPFFPFYKAESDPLIAQVTTSQPFGLVNTKAGSTPFYKAIENLTIFETEPDLSRLDFYFETSTSGLISELNIAVATDTGGAFGFDNFNLSQLESNSLNTTVTTKFYPTDITDSPIEDSEINSFTVFDGDSVQRFNEWTLVASQEPGTGRDVYELTTNAYQYYGPGGNTNQSYTFNFAVKDVVANVTTNVYITGQLGNVAPTINAGITQSINKISGTTGVISTQGAVNGSNPSGGSSTLNITWSIVSGAASIFTINAGTGAISNSSTTAAGIYTLVIRATDAGGLFQDATLSVVFGNAPVPSRFIIAEETFRDGEGITYYFTNPENGTPDNSFYELDNSAHVITDSLYRSPDSQSSIPTSGTPSTAEYVCTSNGNKYLFKKQYKGNWFEGGNDAAFYIAIKNSSTVANRTTGTTVSVEWRNLDRGNPWAQAYDINGQKANFGMITEMIGATPNQTVFDQVRCNENGQLTTAPIHPSNPEYLPQLDYRLNVTNGNYAGITGYRIFAFNGKDDTSNTDGEYRITLGNFSGTNLEYDDCTTTPNSTAGSQTIELGDASYGGSNGSGAYAYSVSISSSNATCSSSMTSGYYAREWITKYVTQLYTDQAMTIEASFGSAVTRRFKRDGENQEGTIDGSYLAPFETTGIRKVGHTGASIECVLST